MWWQVQSLAVMAVLALSLVFYLVEHCACLRDLYLHRVDADIAQGRYDSSSDVGISFNSSSTHLGVLDLFGNEVLLVEEISANERWIRIQGNTFLQLYTQDYYIPPQMISNTMFKTKELNVTVLNILEAYPSHYHQNNLLQSVKALLEDPLFEVMKRTVYTLGSTLQLNGDVYPSLLPLYLVVNMVDKFQVTNANKSSSHMNRDESCFEECPPCPDEECLSLCGYGCHCWKWVCGDCCYHLGCHGHDICCRENFIQTKCLFPISFKCESEYTC